MRPVKLAAYIIGGLVALVIVALVLAVVLIDPNKYKGNIERLVQAKTGRQLVLAGDLKFSIFPWLALETGAVQLAEDPAFGREPFVAVQHARLGVRLLPLLHKQLEIGEVTLDAPRIRLLTDAGGRSNWQSLTGNTANKEEEIDKGTGGPGDIPTVAGVHIRDGAVTVENRQTGSAVAVSKLELETGRVTPGQPVDFKMSAAVTKGTTGIDIGKARTAKDAAVTAGAATQVANDAALTTGAGTQMNVELTTRISADAVKKLYELQKLELSVAMPAAAAKPALSVKFTADSAKADLEAQTLQIPKFNATAGSARLNGALAGTGILKEAQWTGHLTLEPVSLRELLPEFGIAVPVTQDAAVLKKFGLEAALQARSGSATSSLTLSALTLQLDDTRAKGTLGIADIAKNALRFDLDVDRIDFDRYLPPKPPKTAANANKPAGKSPDGAAASKPTELPLDLIRSLDVRGDLKVAQTVFDGIHLSKLHLGLDAHDGALRLNPSQATLYGGAYSGDIRVDAGGQVARVSLDEHVNGVDFAPLLKDVFATQRVSGHGSANIKAAGAGRTTDDLVRTLDGNLDFNVNNGAFEGVDLWYEIRRARALIRSETVPARSGPEHTVFQALKGSGVIKAGVLDNKDLAVDTPFLKIAGQGSFNLSKQNVDYHLTASVLRLPREGAEASHANTVGKDLVDARIPIKVSGPVGSLTVLPDFEGYLKDQGKQRLNEEKDKLQDKLKDKLKGLFGGH